MIEIGMNPILYDSSSIVIRWWGVMVVLAVATVCLMTLFRSLRAGFSSDDMYLFLTCAVVGGIIGARLVHVIDYWDLYQQDLLGAFRVWEGGMGAHGAIFGAIVGGWIYAVVRKLPLGQLCNLAALGAALALSIARIGCTINGCCYGAPTSLPWGIVYTHPDRMAPLGIAVHPTQIYEMLWCLVIFAVLWRLRFKLIRSWTLALLFLSMYSFGRIFIFIFRENEPFLFGLKEGPIIAIAALLVCLPLLIYLLRTPIPE